MTDHSTVVHAQPSRRRLILLTGIALATAAVILLVGVFPAEYNRDPTGLGKATGIATLWAPPEVRVSAGAQAGPAARSYAAPYRSDTVTIALATGDDAEGRNELEYKVRLRAGGSVIYSWSVSGIADPTEFYTEFHGHTDSNGKTMTVADYRKASGAADNGMLVAPFTGIHGWYFQNQSVSAVRVTLHIAGFYELVPPGQPGNEKRIVAKPVAV